MTQNRETSLNVSGMACQSCVGRVSAALRGLAGVREVEVRLREGKVVVRHDEIEAPIKRLLDALAGAGYEAAPGA